MKDYEKIVLSLEKEGKFNEDVCKPNPKYYKTPDSNYKYLPNNIFFKFFSLIIRFIMFIFGPVVTYLMYHLKIKGRKNIKNIKTGAITICNHVSPIDSPLIVRQAMIGKSLYCTAAPTNNKKGFSGLILKAGGILPFPVFPSTARKFNQTIKYLLEEKKAYVNFHPEHGYWIGYKKPRPLYRGAFYYAAKHNVPIIPTFICYRNPNKIEKFFRRKKLITLIVEKPIYPNPNYSENENENYLMSEAKLIWDNIYKNFYKVDEITYLCNQKKNY